MFATLGALVVGSLAFVGSAFALKSLRRNTTPGIFEVLDISECGEGGFCFYNNEVTAYGRPIFKPTGDISTGEAFLGVTFLGPNEAIVVITTVPDALYWSFIPYLWRKAETAEGFGPTITPSGEDSYILFSSMNNGVNNFDFPSATEICIIMTRNAQVYEQERRAILSNFPNLTIAPIWVPNNVTYDSPVQLILRGSFFPPGGIEYYSQNNNGRTYKVNWENIGMTDVVLVLPDQPRPVIPSGSIPLIIKPLPTEPSEFPLEDAFNSYVNQILSDHRVITELIARPYLKDVTGRPITSGWSCYYNNVMCLADNPSATYITTEVFGLEEGRTSVIVCAVNHRITQRSFYCNLNFYDSETEKAGGSTTPSSSELFYSQAWSPGTGDYRVVERSYVQLPENTAPSTDTMVFMRVFIVDYISNPPPFSEGNLNVLNPNTKALETARILMTE